MRTKTAAKILGDLEAKRTRLIARSVEIGDRLASLEYAIKSPAKSWRRRGPRSIRFHALITRFHGKRSGLDGNIVGEADCAGAVVFSALVAVERAALALVKRIKQMRSE
jgi:hypothetical protein